MTQSISKPQYQTGDHVRIIDAEPGAPDPKSLVYYDFYRNLTGVVIKAYPDDTVALSIDRKSLPEPVLKRHERSEQFQRDRWLNGLSDEDRNRLTEKERSFSLRYTLLVAAKHVVPEIASANTAKSKPSPKAVEEPQAAPAETPAQAIPDRATSTDLDAAEEAYLRSKQVG